MKRLQIAFPYLLFLAMGVGVYWSNTRGATKSAAVDKTGERIIDPVCKMEVNAAWGFAYQRDDKTIRFCSAHCRDLYIANPQAYAGQRCIVCRAPLDGAAALPATYLGRTYYTCSQEHRGAFKRDPAGFFMHRMWGIPDWLYYISIGVVLLVSFLVIEGASVFRRRRRPTGDSAHAGDGVYTGAAAFRPRPAAPLSQPLAFARGSLAQAPVGALALPTRMSAVAISLPVLPSRAADPSGDDDARSDRIDLMRIGIIRTMLLSRRFRFVVQSIVAAAFVLIIAAGLFGNQNPGLNIAPLLTWTIWWAGLVVLIMFAGKAWCYMCPWDAIAGWAERLHLWKKTDDGAGLNLRWPRVVRNVSLATVMFVGLTWVELGFGVTMRPAATAYLAIAMLLMAIVSAFLFDRKSFCRYGCLVGRISGLYAMFSGIEVRPRDREVCRTCRGKECVTGSATAYGCPTFEYVGRMTSNTYCIQCTECLQACSQDNIAVNLRPWGEDLRSDHKPRRDEAYLALLMLSLSGFHGLTMTPIWKQIVTALEQRLPFGRITAFSTGMAALMLAPILIYAALVWVSYRISADRKAASQSRAVPSPVTEADARNTQDERNPESGRSLANRAEDGPARKRLTYFDYFVRYAYCVLPIALFYHLAHNLEHLLMEGQKVIALISDPFGWGWNVFGTAGWVVPPLVSLDVLWVLQVILVGVGHVYSLWAASKISRRMFNSPTAAARGQWPMLIGMIAFSVLSLWLLKQPMEMRTSAM